MACRQGAQCVVQFELMFVYKLLNHTAVVPFSRLEVDPECFGLYLESWHANTAVTHTLSGYLSNNEFLFAKHPDVIWGISEAVFDVVELEPSPSNEFGSYKRQCSRTE